MQPKANYNTMLHNTNDTTTLYKAKVMQIAMQLNINYNTMQVNVTQYNTMLHNTKYNTMQLNTTKCNKMQRKQLFMDPARFHFNKKTNACRFVIYIHISSHDIA